VSRLAARVVWSSEIERREVSAVLFGGVGLVRCGWGGDGDGDGDVGKGKGVREGRGSLPDLI